MKKTLIVVAHPNIENSVVNQCWINELKKYPDQFTVHELYKAYPDGRINIETEQRLVEQHESLALQFPVYWFNCPPMLKQWLDEVFLYGWAYGSTGDKLKNKKIALAVTAGIELADYMANGRYKFTMQEVLRPFEITIKYVGAEYVPHFAFYGAEYNPSREVIKENAVGYVKYLTKLTYSELVTSK
ncbi:NAD(P)H-dependent oxidoreductase [Salmonella enterica]|nr:NAD(P)H-dependent oxidoreductase [Salmonella enterica]